MAFRSRDPQPAEPTAEAPVTADHDAVARHGDATPAAPMDPAADAVARYEALAGKIAAATWTKGSTALPRLTRRTGEDYLHERVSARLGEADAPPGLECQVRLLGDALVAGFRVPDPRVTTAELAEAGEAWADWIAAAGDLPRMAVHVPDQSIQPGCFFLITRPVSGPEHAWRHAGQAAARFRRDAVHGRGVLAAAGLATRDGATPQPTRWAETESGAAVVMRPAPGQTVADIAARSAGLRQALAAPNLRVTEAHENGQLLALIELRNELREATFPKTNPLAVTLFPRPESVPAAHAAGADFVLPVGVRRDGSPILIAQATHPHMAVFGGTGAGKTVLLTGMVKAACVQGAEVVLCDAKAGKDLRGIAAQRIPGVVHYAAGCDALLHRAVAYVADELSARKEMQRRLSGLGVEYRPRPMLLVFDEVGAWLNDALSGGDKAAKAAATRTKERLSFLAAQARELRIYLLLAGQHSYVSAFDGKLRSNTSTLIVLGPPSEQHLNSLFSSHRDDAAELGRQIDRNAKGRGMVFDAESEAMQMFQGFYSEPGSADDRALTTALRRSPPAPPLGRRVPDRSRSRCGGWSGAMAGMDARDRSEFG